MPLATKNGSIIVKDGKLAENCDCCVECINVSYSTSDLLPKGCGGGGIQHGLRTIEIPQRFPLPASVHISGTVDDDLSVDGSVVQGGQYVDSRFPACNPAHEVCYSFTAASRTFTIAAVDNYGFNTSYSLKICFGTLGPEGACCEGTTCSVKPQCQCQGAGKTFKGVGTVCEPNPCVKTTCSGFDLCGWCPSPCPQEIQVRLSNCQDTYYGSDFESMNGTYSLALQPFVPGLNIRFYRIALSGFKAVSLRFLCIGSATGYAMSCTATVTNILACQADGVAVHPFTSCCASESFASNNGTGFLFSFQGERRLDALSFTAEVMC